MKPVVLTAVAKNDVRNAAAYYDEQSESLGDKFLDRVQEAIDGIARNPLGYAIRFDDVRMAALKQFPYGLWFHAEEDGSIVVACLSHRRDPILAKERARGVIEIPKPKS